MTTIVFSAIGTAVGGPVGGALGAFIGRQADALLLGGHRRGPRLRELDVTLSTYGQAIPRIYGRMRVPGAVIWATELQEHAELRGSKGQPAVTAYSYTANLAVALSSRPITALGRIWADGKLLRGRAGDMKVGGTLRIYRGTPTQAPDPLIAADQPDGHCPAFRGLAYVVFEALDLSDFGNRVPTLTFEVIADEGVRLDALLETVPDAQAFGTLDGLAGLIVDDSLGDCLAALDPVLPIGLDACAAAIRVRAADAADTPLLLPHAAGAADDASFAPRQGSSARRAPAETQPAPVLRYLDVARDYQPGTQHATGRAGAGQPDVVELPAALQAATARRLVEKMARRRDRAREQIAWRTCALNTAVAPGTLVRLPDRTGTWRVESWEWREAGIELELVRVEAGVSLPALPPMGSFPPPLDEPLATPRLAAFELPWDGRNGALDQPRVVAAVSATGANWSGAALFLDSGDGQLRPLGPSGRTRAAVGTVAEILPPATPLLLDRTSQAVVELASPDLVLAPASLVELAQGANLALLGDELVQFAKAEPLEAGRWRLSHLLRGRGGTEAAIATHAAGEPFALIDARLTPVQLGEAPAAGATVLALGRGDPEPAAAEVRLPGIANRPLAPVHARTARSADGSQRFSWTRRARGNWSWSDGVALPLAEEAERYIVTLEQDSQVRRQWTVAAPTFALTATERADLMALVPAGRLFVRQQGTRGVSAPLALADLR